MSTTRSSEHPPRTLTRRVLVDGVEVEARVDRALLDEVLVPLLREAADHARARAQAGQARRSFVFLVAPPGAGKSTLAALIREEAAERDIALDVLGLDGFHHSNAHLASRPLDPDDPHSPALSTVKGAPATFDVDALLRDLATARDEAGATWPVYDRRTHEVSPTRLRLGADLALLEGTWLLLDEPGWREVAAYADRVVFLDADPADLRERLVGRKERGGLDRAAAEAFYERSDRANVERVLAHSDRSRVDVRLRLLADGSITHPGGQQ